MKGEMGKSLWLGRTLLLGPRLALVTSERQFQSVARSVGIKDGGPWLEKHQHACVHSYDDEDGLICIVALSLPHCQRMRPIDVAALLAHEAVHVWQRVAEMMEGASLGREMEAYAVQNIVANLMDAYVSNSERRKMERRSLLAAFLAAVLPAATTARAALSEAQVFELVEALAGAKKRGDHRQAAAIALSLAAGGISLQDGPHGTSWLSNSVVS